jgi:hypothetical protein
MPLVPFYAVFAAWGASRLVESVRSRALRVVLAGLALALPAAAAWKLTSVRAAPDSSTQVARWVRENVKPDERVHVFPAVDLPLFYSEEAIRESGQTANVLYWMHLQRTIPDALRLGPRYLVVQPKPQKLTLAEYADGAFERLQELGVKYVVITGATEKMRDELWTQLEIDLETKAELVFRAVPVGDASEGRGQVNIRYAQRFDVDPLLVHLFRAHCMGNTLDVYRMPTR